MLIRSFKRSWFYLLISAAIAIVTSNVVFPQPLIVPYTMTGFLDNTESFLPILFAVYCSFLFPSFFEIELSLVCGVKTGKFVFSKAIPVFIYTVIPCLALIPFYRYTPFKGDVPTKIPIFVPDGYKTYMFISLFVTFLFSFALFLFYRVATRNCYITAFLSITTVFAFYSFNKSIQQGSSDLRLCLIDPHISIYFLGNRVPNDLSEQFERMKILKNAWTVNRLIFLILSLGLLTATVFLLRRERLHRGMGE